MSLVWTPEMKEIAQREEKGLVKLQFQMKHAGGGDIQIVGPMGKKRCLIMSTLSMIRDDDPRLDEIARILDQDQIA